MKNKLLVLTTWMVLASLLVGCSLPTVAQEETTSALASDVKSVDLAVDDFDAAAEEETERPEGWDETTHGKETDPDYETVFPQDEVNRIDITISAENWQVMQEDMTEKYGEFGTKTNERMAPGGQRPQNQEGGQRPQVGQGEAPVQDNRQMAGGMVEDDASNPVWVPVTIEFEGDTWTSVGLRFKGNSSLKNSWSQGSYKIPLKLDFDEFEDDYPEIDDQRFYGFKQLSLASNFNDASYSREKVVSEIFSEAGVPSAETAFYEVYVDYGEGPEYFGLYTMVEVIDDTVIETQFEDDSGNVYKPSGSGASFAAGSFSEASFDKETNQDEDDYSDILALYDALHAGTRTTDPATWRANLESVFDVSGFLNYLAVNTVVQNWDTYGLMTHNYYLYNDPTTGQLTWIPWDNNEALKTGRMKEPLSFSMDEVNERWPLIRYLLDDSVYQAEYVKNVEEVINGAFDPDTIAARYEEVHELVRLSALAEDDGVSQQAFENALTELIRHAESRYQAASEYLRSFK
jgi:spore coat protein H